MGTESGISPRSSSTVADGFEVVEITLLLTTARAEALTRVATSSGLTVGTLVRRMIRDFLRGLDSSSAEHRRAGGQFET
jgi:hypothetical protein